MKIKSARLMKQVFSIHKLTYGYCSTCGRRDNDGGKGSGGQWIKV